MRSVSTCPLNVYYTKFQIEISKHVKKSLENSDRGTYGRTHERTLPQYNTTVFFFRRAYINVKLKEEQVASDLNLQGTGLKTCPPGPAMGPISLKKNLLAFQIRSKLQYHTIFELLYFFHIRMTKQLAVTAVVHGAKLCSDYFVRKSFHRIWITMVNPLVKRASGSTKCSCLSKAWFTSVKYKIRLWYHLEHHL